MKQSVLVYVVYRYFSRGFCLTNLAWANKLSYPVPCMVLFFDKQHMAVCIR